MRKEGKIYIEPPSWNQYKLYTLKTSDIELKQIFQYSQVAYLTLVRLSRRFIHHRHLDNRRRSIEVESQRKKSAPIPHVYIAPTRPVFLIETNFDEVTRPKQILEVDENGENKIDSFRYVSLIYSRNINHTIAVYLNVFTGMKFMAK